MKSWERMVQYRKQLDKDTSKHQMSRERQLIEINQEQMDDAPIRPQLSQQRQQMAEHRNQKKDKTVQQEL